MLYLLIPLIVPAVLLYDVYRALDERYRYPLWHRYWRWHQKVQKRKKVLSTLDESLLRAVRENNTHNVEIFLERGANPNLCYFAQLPLLLRPVVEDNVEIARLLLKHGAEVDACDPTWKATPLIYAAIKGRCDATTLLLEHGASLTQKSHKERDAFYYASVNNHPEVTQLLLKEAIRQGIKPTIAEALMTFALEKKLEEIVVLLEKMGVCRDGTPELPAASSSAQAQATVRGFPGGRHRIGPLRKKGTRQKRTPTRAS